MNSLFLSLVLFGFLSNCQGNFQANTTKSAEQTNLVQREAITVELKKDKVYEIAYAKLIPDKKSVLFEEYFPKAGPIIAEYGGKNMASFSVIDIKKGGILQQPDMLVLFEWPSWEIYQQTISDERLKKLFPLRDSTFEDFGQTFTSVEEDVTIEFKKDKSYEFFMAWLRLNGQKPLGEYFAASAPIKKSYGRPEPIFKANLQPLTIENNTASMLTPHIAGIVEWDDVKDPDLLTSHANFKEKATSLFEEAIERIEMIHGKINIQN